VHIKQPLPLDVCRIAQLRHAARRHRNVAPCCTCRAFEAERHAPGLGGCKLHLDDLARFHRDGIPIDVIAAQHLARDHAGV
jgi:hypothetical protein